MPSFLDSGFIVLLALLLFGPKKLPVLARQLGKLMAEFRRASNDFRTQMEEELRISEEADRQKQIAAANAAAAAKEALPPPGQPSLPSPESAATAEPEAAPEAAADSAATPSPVASSGDLSIMPPSTGLPVPNSSLNPAPSPSLSPYPGQHSYAASAVAPLSHSQPRSAPNGAGPASAPAHESADGSHANADGSQENAGGSHESVDGSREPVLEAETHG